MLASSNTCQMQKLFADPWKNPRIEPTVNRLIFANP
ncbi:hypothetical protein I3843_07G036000 [Carya illinoinensis]|uniref:Uncharacterized protein n=1 Tax=Carya illinoinensis TaxID=32201 RepID=A0A8T1Q1D7_CARIL|nr:hypothetical protein CIPAW_07G036800 [Carya illinoinensis]KAG7969551.1 hypothetical protein I3843_07G036000 [Carya illinoinensis]